LWSDTLESKTEDELSQTMQRLELAQRDLQTLLNASLYRQVPRKRTVAPSLKPTNILVNDPHYRKVAALWRAWVRYGHKRQETQQQRSKRRSTEAGCWDRFALHLVVRGLIGLGWSLQELEPRRWRASRAGSLAVTITQDEGGVVRLSTDRSLALVPLCTDLSGTDPGELQDQVETLDSNKADVVLVHVGAPSALADLDRANGWTFRGKTALFGCSPWGIDSEERMARLLRGWLIRAASPTFPVLADVPALGQLPRSWTWIRYQEPHLIAWRPPTAQELTASAAWASTKAKELETIARRAKAAKQAYAVAPREAVRVFRRLVKEAPAKLSRMEVCPVCGGEGIVEPRPGHRADGADATWWAMCAACSSEWGTRPCTGCGSRYHALEAQAGLDLLDAAANTPGSDWPDRVLGRDVWAQPCRSGARGEYRCPECGACSRGERQCCPSS